MAEIKPTATMATFAAETKEHRALDVPAAVEDAPAPPRRGRACPHCGNAKLIEHPAEPVTVKSGALHCNACGCCLLADLSGVRAGTMECAPGARTAKG